MLICVVPPVCFLCSQLEFCAYKMQDASYTLLFMDPLVPLVAHKFFKTSSFSTTKLLSLLHLNS
jgi:hypothetical protein